MSGISQALGRGIASAWSHRWAFAVPVATLVTVASLYVVHLRDTYRATSLVTVRPVNQERVGGAIPVAGEARSEMMVAAARDRLLAPSIVGAMIPVLLPAAKADDPMVVAKAKTRVAVDQVGDAAFTVSIEDTVPERAAKAVNTLIDAFVADERADRVRVATKRSEIVGEELSRAQGEYDKRRADLDAFRAQHSDTLPESKDAIAAEIARAEGDIREREAQATSARRLLQEYDKLIRQAPATIPAGSVAQSAEEAQLTLQLTGQQAALDAANKQLAELRSRYQEIWPAIVSLKEEVLGLEKKIAVTRTDLDAAHRRAEKSSAERRVTDAQGLLQTLKSLRDSVAEDEKRAGEAAEAARSRLVDVQKRRAALPLTEADLLPLKTRYEEAKRQMELREKEASDARIAADVYARGDAADTTGYKVENKAVPPALPSGPARVRWLGLALAAGLALGYGILLLQRRFEDVPIETVDDLIDLVPGAIVVTVPLLGVGPSTPNAFAKEIALGAFVLACVLLTAFALAAFKGFITTPEWFRPWIGGGA